MIRIAFRRVLQNVAEDQADAGKALDRSDHQIGKRLSAALRLRLIDLQEGLEARLRLCAAQQGSFHLLEEVHVGRIRSDQIIAMLQNDLSDGAVLPPRRVDPLQSVEHFPVHLVDWKKVVENRFDFRLVEQIALVGIFFRFLLQRHLEELNNRFQNANVVRLRVVEVEEVIVSHGELLAGSIVAYALVPFWADCAVDEALR